MDRQQEQHAVKDLILHSPIVRTTDGTTTDGANLISEVGVLAVNIRAAVVSPLRTQLIEADAKADRQAERILELEVEIERLNLALAAANTITVDQMTQDHLDAAVLDFLNRSAVLIRTEQSMRNRPSRV